MILKRAFQTLVLLGVTFGASAAVQGELGITSVAELDISVNIQPTIQINNVSDVQLDIFDVTRDAEITQTLCVRGTPDGRYSIIASGTEATTGAFVLTNTDGAELTFRLSYTADLADGTRDELTPGVASPLYNVLSSSADCDGSNTSSFTIVFDAESLQQVASGTYTGFLTLFVAPQ